MAGMNWAELGSRILRLTEEAVRVQREEEPVTGRADGMPFLRLVQAEAWDDVEVAARDAGSAA